MKKHGIGDSFHIYREKKEFTIENKISTIKLYIVYHPLSSLLL